MADENVNFVLAAKNLTGQAFRDVQAGLKGMGEQLSSVQSLGAALGVTLSAAAFAAFVKGAADTEDQLGKMAQKAGLSVEALSALKYSGALADVSLEALGIGLKQLSRSMFDAQSGSGDAAAAFRALGIQVTDARGQLKPTEQQLLELADRFARMEDGAGKTALALKIFGKSGADMIPLLNQGADGIRANTEEARKLGIVISTEAAKQAEEFNDNLRKLHESSAALSRELAGPLIKALSDTAAEFIKARKEGEGFFGAMVRGTQELLTGNDAYKHDKAIVEATDVFVNALNRLDNAKARVAQGFAGENEVKRWAAEVARAKGELDMLIATKPIIAPPAAERKPGGTESAPILPPTGDSGAAAKAQEDADEEFRTTQREAWEAYYKFLRQVGVDTTHEITGAIVDGAAEVREITLQSGQYYLDLADQVEGARALQEQYNEETQLGADAATNAYFAARGARQQALVQSLMTEQELENIAYQERLAQLAAFSDDELAQVGGYAAAREMIETQHQAKLGSATAQGLLQRRQLEQMSATQQFAFYSGTLAQVTAAGAQHNRTLFQLNKAANISNAIISTLTGATKALEWGFPLGPIFAGIITAAGFANVAAISAQQFGGGAAAEPATPTFNANPNTGFPESGALTPPSAPAIVQAPIVQGREINLTLISESGIVSADWVRNVLIPSINDAVGDGVVLKVTT